MIIRLNVTGLATLITELREVAETVRTYGGFGTATIAAKTPAELYVVAAQLESHLRGFVQADVTVGRSFAASPSSPEPLTFDELRPVASHVTPCPISSEVQVAELRAAAARLRQLTGTLAEIMESRATHLYVARLEAEAATIDHFAGTLA